MTEIDQGADTPPSLERAVTKALRALAVSALDVGIGGRLPSSAYFQDTLDLGAGTVQGALGMLHSSGALTTRARGHMGRLIQDINIEALWGLANLGVIKCQLSPPGSLEQRGLVEALEGELDRVGVPHTISHRRGAAQRARDLRHGRADLVVMSAGSLQKLEMDGDSPRSHKVTLSEDTYYAHDQIVVVTRAGWQEDATAPERIRVAIDRDSWDQTELTEAEFPPALGYTFVPWAFPRAPEAVARSQADVAVWHRLELLLPLDLAGLTTRTLRREAAVKRRAELSAATVLLSEARPELPALFHHLDLSTVHTRQAHLLGLPKDHPELMASRWSL